ncbi:MAG: PD-(D/E)XK nuclease family protein [Nitrospinaceae bacterium]
MTDPIPENTPVLTVNSRLARWLLFKHHKKNEQAQLQVWNTPEILNLASWFKDRWMQSWPDRYVLSELQCRRIWEEIIRSDPECLESKTNSGIRKPWTLLHGRSAADQAAKAYALIREYKLHIDPGSLQTTRETNFFTKWARRYEKRLEQLGALDPSSLMDRVREAMAKGSIPVPERIVLAGFEEFTPQQQVWLDFLKSQKTDVRLDPDPKAPALPWEELTRGRNVRIASFPDRRNESVRCARWIRSVHQPGKSIGIVVPDLEGYHRILKNELKAELAPASVYPWEEMELPFNISLGSPLAEEAMVQVLLKFFSAVPDSIPLTDFLYVLKSPFLRTEPKAVSGLELTLIKANAVTVRLSGLEKLLDPENSSGLISLIKSWREFIKNKDKRTPSEWAGNLSKILKKLGWPSGNRRLPGREAQCLKTWRECLNDFASLDHLTGNLSRGEAADELSSIAREKQFHVKTKEQPIQVVGLLESAGMTFDHLWVMGCTSECLPAPPNPNPFLPLPLQRKLSLPHADPNRELMFAENSIRRLLYASPDVVFSYPLRKDDNELNMSPLLSQLLVEETEWESAPSHRLKDLFPEKTELELFQDRENIPASGHERDRFSLHGMKSGYKVLKDQADCPFRAFAAHRLGAETLELPDIDFDARHRGILIHKALEIFWKQTRTQQQLIQLKNEGRLESVLEHCAGEAMEELAGKLYDQTQFAAIEKERTVNLLKEWMQEEFLRPDFKVDHEEKGDAIEIGELKLLLRIDRIDTAQNGSKLLIDYKTGSVRPLDWFEERVQEPQLPLYACKLKPDGIAFACVARGESKWRSLTDKSKGLVGLGKPPQKIPPSSGWPDWQNVLDYWKNNLTQLARQFMEGRLDIDPYKPTATCRNCGFNTLCRVGELALGLNDEEES